MSPNDVVETCCREVCVRRRRELERRVPEEDCKKVLEKSVREECWREVRDVTENRRILERR